MILYKELNSISEISKIEDEQLFLYNHSKKQWEPIRPELVSFNSLVDIVNTTQTITEKDAIWRIQLREHTNNSNYLEAHELLYRTFKDIFTCYNVSLYNHIMSAVLKLSEPEEQIILMISALLSNGMHPFKLESNGFSRVLIESANYTNEILNKDTKNIQKTLSWKRALNAALALINTELSYPSISKDESAANDFFEKRRYRNILNSLLGGFK